MQKQLKSQSKLLWAFKPKIRIPKAYCASKHMQPFYHNSKIVNIKEVQVAWLKYYLALYGPCHIWTKVKIPND